MGWKLVLCLFVGLCTASYSNTNNGWRKGAEYVYKVQGQAINNYDDNQYEGILLQADLTVRPQSDGVLIAKISNAQHSRYNGDEPIYFGKAESQKLDYKPLPLNNKPFRIVMERGVVKIIDVHTEVSHWEENLIKSIVSQIQFNIEGTNLERDRINQLPENGSVSGTYKTMENTVSGKFATLYELSEATKGEIQEQPWRVPYPQLKGADGAIIKVVKTTDHSKSKERVMYSYGFANEENSDLHENWMGNFMTRTSLTQAFLSGSPSQYTVQSVFSFDVITAAPLHNSEQKFAVQSSYNITLSKYQPTASQFDLPSPLKPLDSLTYSYNDQNTQGNRNCDENSSGQSCNNNNNQQEQRNGKNTASSSSLDSSFSAEFNSMSDESDWKEDQPQLSNAPKSSLLPLSMGYMGQPINSNKQVNIVQSVQKLANEIGQGIKNPDAKQDPQTLARFVILCSLMRRMNVQELQQVAEALYNQEQGTQKYYSWEAVRDGLAEAGTGPALLVLSQLMTQKKISPQTAAFVFDQITHSSRHPTNEYMRALFMLSQNPQIQEQPELRAVIQVAYANLVRKVYVNKVASHDQYPVHSYGRFYTQRGIKFVDEEYIPYLQHQLHEAIKGQDLLKAQIYISALGYVAHPGTLKAFRPYFNGEKRATQFQRLQMVLALETFAKYNSKHVQPVLYKLYQNAGEEESLRVASAYSLMRTRPSRHMLQKMAAFTNIDQSEEVNSAIESVIRAIAELEGPEYEQMSQDAQSVLHLFEGKSYGMQYSKKYFQNNYISETNTEFTQVFQTIAGKDSLIPKVMKYSLFTNIDGVKNENLRFEFRVSSVDQLMNALYRQTESYRHKKQQQDQHSGKAKQNQWSGENIARMFKIHRAQREELDGSFSFQIAGIHKRFAFNDETIKGLVKAIAQVEQSLQNKQALHFTKFINPDDMVVSTPTIMGIPFIYSYDNPTLIHFEGEVTANAEPKVSSNGVLHLPKKVKVNAQVKAIISSKKQGHLGFVVPFTSEHFLMGYEKNMQLQIPLNVQIAGDIDNNQYTIQMNVIEPQQNHQLFSYNSLPYIAVRSVVDFTPVIEGSRTRIMKEEKLGTNVNQVMGEDSTGMPLRVQLKSDDKINYAWFVQQAQQYDGISLLLAPWYDESVSYFNLNVEYEGQRAVNKHMEMHLGYSQSYQNENCGGNGDVNIGQLYKSSNDHQARQKQFYQQACSGISNPDVQVLDAEVKFVGKQEVTYFATASVATSDADPRSNILFYASRQSNGHQKEEPSKVALYIKSHFPNVNGLDALFALKNNYKANIQGQLGYGKDEASASKVNMQATLSKSNEYIKYWEKHSLTKECAKEMKAGNNQLSACIELLSKANAMDKVAAKFQYENIGKNAQNATNHLFNALRHQLYDYYQENSVTPTGTHANQINIEANFDGDFEKVDIEIQTQHQDMLFEDVEIIEHVQPLLNIHPSFSAQSRLLGYAYNSDLPYPYCAIDRTAANTFDNLEYPIQLGNEWNVAFVYTPNHANDIHNQGQQQQQNGQERHRGWIISRLLHPGHEQHGNQEEQQNQYNILQRLGRFLPHHRRQQDGDQQQDNQQDNQHGYQSRYYAAQQVQHNPDQQIEQYSVLVRDKSRTKDQREVKIVIRSSETGHELMEIDMVPSGKSKLHADVFVNQKKQQITQDRSSNYGNLVEIYGLPNGEVILMVRDKFYLLFDSHRIRLVMLDASMFQNDVRGLCGTFTGNNRTDFTTPHNCVLNDPEAFANSYQFNQKTKNQHKANQCYYNDVIYADVVSAQDVEKQSQNEQFREGNEHGSCTRHQTRYVVNDDAQVCFTTKPLPICKQPCQPKHRMTKRVDAYCIPKNQNSDLWIREIKKGASPDFSMKKPNNQVHMEVHHSCGMHN